jgi:hypothetical protein
VLRKSDAVRLSTGLRLVVLGSMLACADGRREPTAVAHGHDPAPLTDVAPTTAPDPLRCTGYPEERIWLESQAWWDSTGLSIPGRVGEHIHVGMCWPVSADGGEALITSNKLHVDVRVLLHDQTDKTHIFRVSDAGTVMQKQEIAIGPGNADLWIPYDVDLSRWPTGSREFRWTARIKTDRHPEQFNSTGWQLCVRSCTPAFRTEPYTEGRGYYANHDYKNARFMSRLPSAPVSGLWTFKIRLLDTGPGGVYVDPDFHNGSAGTVIRATGGPFLGNVTIDTRQLSNGSHRLVLVSSDGNAAGVQVIGFTVNNP